MSTTITLSGTPPNESDDNWVMFFSGIVTMTTSPLRAASVTETGFAPVSRFEISQARRATGIGNGHLMAHRSEAEGESTTDLAQSL